MAICGDESGISRRDVRRLFLDSLGGEDEFERCGKGAEMSDIEACDGEIDAILSRPEQC
jgi:hypothetical protein